MFCRPLFVLFLLAIALSVRLRFANSEYPFGIFKLSLQTIQYKQRYILFLQFMLKCYEQLLPYLYYDIFYIIFHSYIVLSFQIVISVSFSLRQVLFL